MKQSILVAILVTVMVVLICHVFKRNTHSSQQPAHAGSHITDDGPGGFPPLGGDLLHSGLFY